ncbi:MAG TPA: insulinase family protein, partial [Polyangiaceae bacterium]|nr:insulinase family protein [Polyangiaceae bacterium]
MVLSRRVLGGVIVSLCGLGACLGPTRPAVEVAPMQVLKLESREGRFPNRLRVIVETVDESDIAGVALAVDAGSARDPEGQAGLAHLVEHNVFEGRHGDAPSVERRLDQLAARYNAETSHDAVVYHAFAPRRAFDDLLRVFADIAAEPLAHVDGAAFEHQRQVVEAERGLRTEHVQGQVAGYLYDAIFPEGHPYARPVIGTRESVAALDLSMAQAFVAATHRPERMTMYVVAPRSLDPFARVSQVFAPQAGGALAPSDALTVDAFSPPSPLKPVGSLVVHQSTVAAPELWLAWPLPAGTVEERARAKSLSSLTQALIRPSFTSHRAVAHADCGLHEQVLGSVLSCQLVLNDAHDVEDIIDRTLSDLRTGFGDAKTDRDWFWGVQRGAAVNGTLALESLEVRAATSAEQARDYNNPFLDREVLGAVGALDLGAVSALGYELADRKRTYAMLVQPASGASGGP